MSNPMILNTDGVPFISDDFLKELKNFDPNIRLMFSEFKTNVRTFDLVKGAAGNPIYEPKWYVYLYNEALGRPVFMFEVEDGEGYAEPSRYNVIGRIKSDLIRQGFSATEIADMIMDKQDELRRQQEDQYDDLAEDERKANRKFMEDAASGELTPSDFRKGKTLYSYEGQGDRSSPIEDGLKSDKELGLEKVDWTEETKKIKERK